MERLSNMPKLTTFKTPSVRDLEAIMCAKKFAMFVAVCFGSADSVLNLSQSEYCTVIYKKLLRTFYWIVSTETITFRVWGTIEIIENFILFNFIILLFYLSLWPAEIDCCQNVIYYNKIQRMQFSFQNLKKQFWFIEKLEWYFSFVNLFIWKASK